MFRLLLFRPPPTSTLFPYTTLFRSAISLAALLCLPFFCCLLIIMLSLLLSHCCSLIATTSLLHAYCFPHCPLIAALRSEEHTSELKSPVQLVCRLLLVKKFQRIVGPLIVADVSFVTLPAPTDIYTLSLHDALPICNFPCRPPLPALFLLSSHHHALIAALSLLLSYCYNLIAACLLLPSLPSHCCSQIGRAHV